MSILHVSVKPEKYSYQFLEKIEITQINAVAFGFPIKLELRNAGF